MAVSAGGELSQALRALRGAFAAVGAFSCVVNLLRLVPALYMLQVYDRVLVSRSDTTLYVLTLLLLGLLALEALLEHARAKVLSRASAALEVGLGPRLFDASFESALRGQDANAARAMAELAHVRRFLTGRGLFAFFDAPWTPVFILVAFLLNPWLGLFALVSALALAGLAYVNARMTGAGVAQALTLEHSAGRQAAGSLRNAETVAALGMLPALRERWFAQQLRFLAAHTHASERDAALGATTRFFRTALQSAILGFGALLVLEQQLSAGGMIAASIILARALSPVDLLIATWPGFVAAREGYRRLNALLAAYPAAPRRTALPRPAGEVTLENVHVAPPGSREPVLKALNLRVAPGSVVAVLGPSAAGKSTLARTLVGAWAPLGGAVRLDNAELAQWDRGELGRWIGYLPQDAALLDGSVAENIARFGEPDAERIVAAARRAGVHEMVLRLPQGYDTVIGEGGFALSAGQRQRLALARALYGDPALVVLDEPNASLDQAGDEALLAALRELKAQKRTVFVVTHRPNVLALADSVVVLAEGALRVHGPRDSVLQAVRKAA